MDWRPEYAVGVETLDQQHREILDCLNHLTCALDSHDRKALTLRYLEQLQVVMAKHLAVEEALLEIIGYPDLENHKLGHQEIRDRLDQLQQRNATEDICLELVHFLREWFITHILRSDQEYARYMALHFPAVVPASQRCAA